MRRGGIGGAHARELERRAVQVLVQRPMAGELELHYEAIEILLGIERQKGAVRPDGDTLLLREAYVGDGPHDAVVLDRKVSGSCMGRAAEECGAVHAVCGDMHALTRAQRKPRV